MNLENEFTVPVPVDEAWRVLLDVERVAPCMPGAALTSVDGDEFTGTVKVKVGPITVTYKGEARFLSKDDATHRAVIEAKGKESRGSGTAGATVTAQLVGEGSTTKVRVDTELNVTGRPAQFGRGVMAEVAAKLVDQFAKCLEDEINTPAAPAATEAASAAEAPVAPEAPAAAAAAPVPAPSTPAPAHTATPAKKATSAKKTAAAATGTAKKTATAKKASPPGGAPMPPPGGATEAPPAPSAPVPHVNETIADARTDDGPARAATPPPRREAEPIDLFDVAGGSVAKRVAPIAALVLILWFILRRRRSR